VKLTVPILLFLTGSAAAESVTLHDVAASSAPHIVGSEAVCKAADDRLRMQKLKLDGHEVQILRTCKAGSSRIAFETKDGWRERVSGPADGMELTSIVKIGKRRVLLHRMDRRVSDDKTTSRIDVCSYKDDVPQCGVLEVECPETGCREPSVVKGALWLHAKGGRKRFPIE
jgi:hypothetical protein